MLRNYLRLILIGLVAVLVALSQPAPAAAQDSAHVVRRLATTARLAAEEYRRGVVDGKVVLAVEVDEARLFLEEARRAADRLPESVRARAIAGLARAQELVRGTADPDSVVAGVERLVTELAGTLGVTLEEIPVAAPSLARGAEVYRQNCASCHGVMGRGNGLAGRALDPPPTNLADPAALSASSPLDFYRRVTIGTAGTAMPGFETTLSAGDRWAVALYASTLRLPPARGSVPAPFADFAVTAGMNDLEIGDSLGDLSLERLAAVRIAGEGSRAYAGLFNAVRARVDSSYALAAKGQGDDARSAAIDAYMVFEAIERELRVKDPALATEAELAFADAREEVARGGEAGPARAALLGVLDRVERSLGVNLSSAAVGLQSFVILLREGLEAILIVAALMAFLVKLGAGHRKREIHRGVLAAIGLSLLTAVAIETVFRLTPAHQEALEAGTMVVATVMLFWVSYWLLSKIGVANWNRFVKTKLSEALGKRSSLALASVAFLAVYREGFETVLFYKALAVSGGSAAVAVPIGVGMIAGALVLAAVYVAINRYGVRLPLRPFFAVTSAFLYAMAFNFAGTAIAELQEGGLLPLTPVDWLPRIPALGVYPTMETALVQGALLTLAAMALVWTFVVGPRVVGVRARNG